jgi:osmotically-inducible protein OsmY
VRRFSALLAAALLIAGCQNGGDDTVRQVRDTANALVEEGKLRAKLLAIDVDSADDVALSQHDGVVTVSGSAPSQEIRGRYVAALRAAPGVKGVVDRLRIDPSRRGSVGRAAGDFALVSRVRSELIAQTGVNGLKVKIEAHQGLVTLSGSVPSEAVRATMEATARKIPGIRRLVDRTRIEP